MRLSINHELIRPDDSSMLYLHQIEVDEAQKGIAELAVLSRLMLDSRASADNDALGVHARIAATRSGQVW
jgi:hypothetical protein